MYSEDTLIILLNLTYGMLKNDDKIRRTYMLTDGEKNFVRNFKIVEWNMDKVLNCRCAKDEINIEKFNMLDLKDMLKINIPIKDIISITSLSEEDILKFKSDLNIK